LNPLKFGAVVFLALLIAHVAIVPVRAAADDEDEDSVEQSEPKEDVEETKPKKKKTAKKEKKKKPVEDEEDESTDEEETAATDEPAEEKKTAKKEKKEKKKKKKDDPSYDFENEEAYMDVPDALRSRQYVHRAILSTIIRDTAKVTLGSYYFNHLMGFNAVYQPANRGGKSFAKYVSGVLGFSFGYSSEGGHAGELGLELSGVSNLTLGYRYFFQPKSFAFWPTLGVGVGTEVGLRLSDIPVEAQAYQGQKQMAFLTLGAVVPMVDIALKAEARFNFYGLDRLMLTTGVGVIFFL